MNPQFALGLIVGEGCFTADMYARDTAKFGVSFRAKFKVTMNFKEKHLLERLQEELGGVGTVSGQGEGCPEYCVKFVVRKQDDIEKLIEYVDTHAEEPFYVSRKGASFKVFKDYYDVIPPETMEEAERAVKLSKEMNDTRSGLSEEEWLDRLE